MKNILIILSIFLLLGSTSRAQSPEAIYTTAETDARASFPVSIVWGLDYKSFAINCEPNSQVKTFKLYFGGSLVKELAATPAGVLFPGLTKFGTYTLKGFDATSKEVWTTNVLANPADVRTYSENWANVKTYTSANGGSYVNDIVYLTGFEKPHQKIAVGASPKTGQSVVQPIVYDGLMRDDAKTYLPYPKGVTAEVDTNPIANQIAYYAAQYPGESVAYSQTIYEKSPLGRVTETVNPGAAYQGHRAKVEYGANAASEVFKIGHDLMVSGYYRAGELSKTTFTDEDGNVRIEFCAPIYNDGQKGNLILSRVICGGKNVDTYYVYDRFDRVAYVLPPGATIVVGSTVDVDNSYNYVYDGNGNVIKRHIPYKPDDEFIYDLHNRIIFSKENGVWRYFVYDAHDRVVQWSFAYQNVDDLSYGRRLVGREYHNMGTSDEDRLPASFSPYDFYPSCPFSGGSTCALYRYGDHRFGTDNAGPAIPAKLAFSQKSGYPAASTMTNGLKVYEKIRAVETADYVERAFYYDLYGRLIQSVETTLAGGTLRTSSAYDFMGNMTKQLVSVSGIGIGSGSTFETETIYTYDQRGYMLSEQTFVNGKAQTETLFGYDDMGRPADMRYGVATLEPTVHEELKYTLLGQLARKKSPYFDLQLRYENPIDGAKPAYNGNISETWWQHSVDGDESCAHLYTYDALARLTKTQQKGFYDYRYGYETAIDYDLCGNIRNMSRGVDIRHYGISGNMLTDLYRNDDGWATVSQPYRYDAYRRMTYDGAANLEMSYNNLNFVNKIGGVTLTYLCDGTKAKWIQGGKTYYNIGSLVYVKHTELAAPVFESCAFTGGRLIGIQQGLNTVCVPRFYIADHLGSVRDIVDAAGTVIECNDYTPFGERWSYWGRPRSDNRYLFNGKEEIGFGYLDYGARIYNPEDARWNTADPMADKYYGISPYAYCANNPVKNIDPDGRDYFLSNSGAVVWKNCFDKTIEIDDEIYTNVGMTLSVETIGGTYVNEYQGVAVSISNTPINIIQSIFEDKSTLMWLLGKNSPLSKQAQTLLMQAGIRNAQGNFMGTAADYIGTVLQYAGMGVSALGYGVSLTSAGVTGGLGVGVGRVISDLGNGITYIGTGIRTAVDLRDHNYGQVVVSMLGGLTNLGFNKIVKFGAAGNEAIEGGTNLFFSPMSMMIDNIQYKTKEK